MKFLEAAAHQRALREAEVAWAAATKAEEEAAAHHRALMEAEVAWAAATQVPGSTTLVRAVHEGYGSGEKMKIRRVTTDAGPMKG